MDREWDVVVVGGGAAGLAAAQMTGRSRRSTLVIDAGKPRNRVAAHVHGVLGHDGVAPERLLETGRAEARAYGVVIERGRVVRLDDGDDGVLLTRGDGRVERARAVVVATGARDALPDVPGLAAEWGRGVLHCPYCHGWEVAERRLAVLAMGPMSLHQVQLVRQLSDDVAIFTAAVEPLADQDVERLVARGIRIVPEAVRAVERRDEELLLVTADGREHAVDAVFTGGPPSPDLDAVEDLGLERRDVPGRLVAVDALGRTSRPRVFAAGDTAGCGNVPGAMASGAAAGAGANAALVEEDVVRAVRTRAERRAADWEQRYADRDRFWSGDANAAVATTVQGLEPGSALDVGSGEGGDVVWLAQQGWRATGVDLSPTAVRRAQALARERGVEARFVAGDGAAAVDGAFDLVLAGFLHSWEPDFPRIRLLRDAADRVAPGGRLLVVSHAAPPPGADTSHGHGPLLRSPEEELALLDLDPAIWSADVVEVRRRTGTTPGGAAAEFEDGVLLLRRSR